MAPDPETSDHAEVAEATDEDSREAAARHWDTVTTQQVAQSRSDRPRPTRFWESDPILQHINQRISGNPSSGWASGLREVIKNHLGDRVLGTGVSVGGGLGAKEIFMIEAGIVERFTIFEISPERVRLGREYAAQRGFAELVTFETGDALADTSRRFDLVYWDNSLHHMPDVAEAVEWSRAVLNPDGLFVGMEFVGPNRFQWTDRMLATGRTLLTNLPDRFFDRGDLPPYARGVTRPTIEQMIATDPTEAPDSERIVSEVQRVFPGTRFFPLGGSVYHLALNGILENFEEDDRWILNILLLVDDLMSGLGENHYGALIADAPPVSPASRSLRDRLLRRAS